MIKSMNQNLEFDQDLERLFEELENRPEFGCSGAACGAKGTACGINT